MWILCEKVAINLDKVEVIQASDDDNTLVVGTDDTAYTIKCKDATKELVKILTQVEAYELSDDCSMVWEDERSMEWGDE